jgi:hypothetical protein
MIDNNYYEQVLLKKPISGDKEGEDGNPNYKRTADPNVFIGRHGIRITKKDMDDANKNGMAWTTMENFADWLGSWGKKVPDFKNLSPVYRTYPEGKIDGGDIAILMAKDDPSINKILARNIAKQGEAPMFGAEDSDSLRALIAANKSEPTNVDYMSVIKPKK